MLVRPKDSSKAYYDREQGVVIDGETPVNVSATTVIRSLLASGELVEVEEKPASKTKAGAAEAPEAEKLNK